MLSKPCMTSEKGIFECYVLDIVSVLIVFHLLTKGLAASSLMLVSAIFTENNILLALCGNAGKVLTASRFSISSISSALVIRLVDGMEL